MNYTLTAKDPKQQAFLRPSATTWRVCICPLCGCIFEDIFVLSVASRKDKLSGSLKEVCDFEQKLWVKQYSSTHAYDADHRNCSWESKFSTINDGVSVVVLPRGFKGNVPHGIDFRCLRLPLGYEPPAAVLNEWKEKYNFDDVKVERDARRRELRILIVYGEKRDVDMGGFALHQLLAEEKGRKRSRDTDENCNDGGYPEKRQKAEKQSTPFAVPRNDTVSTTV